MGECGCSDGKCGTCKHMYIGPNGPFCDMTADDRKGNDPACDDYVYSAQTGIMLIRYAAWLKRHPEANR